MSDNFTVTNEIKNSSLNITAINILKANTTASETKTIELFRGGKSPDLNVLVTAIYYGKDEYNVSSTDVKGQVKYTTTGSTKTFKEVINDTAAIRSYSLAGEETVEENLGQLGGTQLTIFGNGHSVNGDKDYGGITVSEGQTLNIEKGTGEEFVWKNFYSSGNGGVLKNSGSINLGAGIVFSSNNANNGGVLANINGGTVTIRDGVTFSSNSAGERGGAIYNYNGSTIDIFVETITFNSNRATGGSGGAIHNDKSTMEIKGNVITFSINDAQYGGAIHNEESTMTQTEYQMQYMIIKE